jgi:hypothetical protein
MKKISFMSMLTILFAALVISVATSACALGPIYIEDHKVTCDAAPSNISGMYIYYSTTSGVFTDTAKATVGDISKIPYDLTVMLKGKPAGTYYIAASFFYTGGSESELSNIVPFVWNPLTGPANERLTK